MLTTIEGHEQLMAEVDKLRAENRMFRENSEVPLLLEQMKDRLERLFMNVEDAERVTVVRLMLECTGCRLTRPIGSGACKCGHSGGRVFNLRYATTFDDGLFEIPPSEAAALVLSYATGEKRIGEKDEDQ